MHSVRGRGADAPRSVGVGYFFFGLGLGQPVMATFVVWERTAPFWASILVGRSRGWIRFSLSLRVMSFVLPWEWTVRCLVTVTVVGLQRFFVAARTL